MPLGEVDVSKDDWWKHVDHELGQLIELHQVFQDPSFADRPELVRRSMDIAFGAAFRALLEFAHSGRPTKEDWSRIKKERVQDIHSIELAGRTLRPEWSEEELIRLRDADKLIGHLSAGRVDREGSDREWGDKKDLEIWSDFAKSLIDEFGERLPRAADAWSSFTKNEE